MNNSASVNSFAWSPRLNPEKLKNLLFRMIQTLVKNWMCSFKTSQQYAIPSNTYDSELAKADLTRELLNHVALCIQMILASSASCSPEFELHTVK